MKACLSPNGKWLFTGAANANVARLYDVPTGRLIRSFTGHSSTIDDVAVSPDSRLGATEGDDRTIRIWDLHTGKELVKIESKWFFDGRCLAWSPDGKYVCSSARHLVNDPNGGHHDAHSTSVWSAKSGALFASFDGGTWGLRPCISPDGKYIYFESDSNYREPKIAKVSLATRAVAATFAAPVSPWSMALSGSGAKLFVAGEETVEVYDAEQGSHLRTINGHGRALFAVGEAAWCESPEKSTVTVTNLSTGVQIGTFPRNSDAWEWSVSGDGRVVSFCGDDSVSLFDTASRRKICETRGLTTPVTALGAPSPDLLATSSDDGGLPIWSLREGSPELVLRGKPDEFMTLAVNRARGLIATGGHSKEVTAWRLSDGGQAWKLSLESDGSFDLNFSPDGAWLAVSAKRYLFSKNSEESAVVVYDVQSRKPIARFKAPSVGFCRFSPDAKYLAFMDGHTVRLVETRSWTEVRELDLKGYAICIAFTPDGQELWATNEKGAIERLSTTSRTQLAEFHLANSELLWLAFSPDGSRFVTCEDSGQPKVYDAKTGEAKLTLGAAPALVLPTMFTEDGKFVVGGLIDGTSRIWDARTGRIVATFVSFKDGTWAVVDPDGRYDASNGGDVDGLFWLLGEHPIALSQLKSYFYDPHLLAKVMGLGHGTPRAVPNLDGVGIFPDIEVSLDPKTKLVTVTESDQGGGIGKTEISLNGVKIGTRAAPPAGTTKFSFRIDTAGANVASRLLPEESAADPNINRLEATPYNFAASLRGRPAGVDLKGVSSGPPYNLYALVVGSNYAGTKRNLRFPESDATSFASGLELAAWELLGKFRVHVTRIVTGTDRAPTKSNLKAAMAQIAQSAKPADIVVVYLAGHGVARANGKEGYYYLTAEAGNSDPEADPLADRYTLSSAELANWLQQDVKAAKRAIIIDTCAAGAAATDLTEPREVSADLERAWEQLKDNAGLFVLAGCAPDRVSYEATNVKHGLLTYSLLEAIDQARPAALASHGYLDVDQWFDYAQVRVRELMNELALLGVQKPEKHAQANSGNYPVGLVNNNVVGKLGLPLPGPVLILDTFRTADNLDPLGLEDTIEGALLSGPSSRGSNAATYWPSIRRHPKALQLNGSYKFDGDRVTVTVRLMHFVGPKLRAEPFDTFEVIGSRSKVPELVASILDAANQRIPQDWERLNHSPSQ